MIGDAEGILSTFSGDFADKKSIFFELNLVADSIRTNESLFLESTQTLSEMEQMKDVKGSFNSADGLL